MLPTKADVVIVGAGPTGLALAATLAKSGVDFVLLDKLSEGANTSRAAVVHARTLEVLETLAVTDRLRADGMHSTVRERAGIGFVGGSYEEAFVLADVRMTWALGRDEVMLYFSPEGVMVVAPLPGGHSGSWRPSTRRRRTRRRPTSSGCS